MTRILTMFTENKLTSIQMENFHDSLIIILRKTYKGSWRKDGENLRRSVPGSIVINKMKDIISECSTICGIDIEILSRIFLSGYHTYFWIDSIHEFKQNSDDVPFSYDSNGIPEHLKQSISGTKFTPIESLNTDNFIFEFDTEDPDFDFPTNYLWEIFCELQGGKNIIYGTYKFNSTPVFYSVHAISCSHNCSKRGMSTISYDAGKVFDPIQDISMLVPLYNNYQFCYNSQIHERENIVQNTQLETLTSL